MSRYRTAHYRIASMAAARAAEVERGPVSSRRDVALGDARRRVERMQDRQRVRAEVAEVWAESAGAGITGGAPPRLGRPRFADRVTSRSSMEMGFP
jgi:hypothetical protein